VQPNQPARSPEKERKGALRFLRVLRETLILLPAFLSASAGAQSVSYERDVIPLLKKYCFECHDANVHKAELAFDDYKTVADVLKARKHFESALRNITRHEMPPEDASAFPTDAERETIAQFIERELFKIDPANPDPGRVVIRRMNRAEYDNAIRDLVGVDFKPAADFPPDDSGYGFDNIGDVLSLPPVLMEKYLAAADRVLDQAIVTEPVQSRVVRVPASLAEIGFNAVGDRGDGWVHLISLEEDDVAIELPILAAGDYIVRFQAFGTKVGGALVGQGSEKPIEFKEDPGPTRIALALNDAFVRDFIVTTDEKNPAIHEARLGVPAGRQRFRAVMRRKRSGENELTVLNGRLGKQQPGIVFVKWIEVEGPLPAATRRMRSDRAEATGVGRFLPTGARVLEKEGEVAITITATRDGEFILRAQAYADQSGAEPVRMEFRLDGKLVHTLDVLAPGQMTPLPKQRVFSPHLFLPQPEVYEHRLKLPPGQHRFAAAFVNDAEDPQNENPNLRDRRLIIQHLEVADLSAPVLAPPIPAPLQELFARVGSPRAGAPLQRSPVPPTGTAAVGPEPAEWASAGPTKPEEAARTIISAFARRAWRRPLAASELDRLLQLYRLARAEGDSFETGVKLALKAALVSPHFLFIGELPAAEARPQTAAASASAVSAPPRETSPLSEYALATRLSFFLWSSVPDDELLALAERGELRRQLEPQVRRLLASPKARALVENFASQWLEIRSLENLQPDRKLFPEFDPALRSAMQHETELFFEHVLREDRSVFDFLRGDYTFVNARLAKFYGLSGVTSDEFRKVSLAETPRRGVLTHASILTLTSNPTRTSPVKRGKWILENLLGTPPPPPPPNVPELEDQERKLTGTLREQMQQHSTNPTCASCHARMDPIGFGFENFNAIGAWRATDGKAPVDASGKLASGDTFAGVTELSELLARKRADDFRRCLAEKMLTYALGRGIEYYDRPAVEKVRDALRADGDRFSALILAVAQSFPFQHQRTE
jgi:hypothetical protein